MKRSLRASLFALCLTALAGTAVAKDEVRTLSKELSIAGASTVALENSVGGVRVEAASGDAAKIDLSIRCEHKRKSCLKAAEQIELVSSTEGDRLLLEVKGFPKRSSKGLSVNAVLRVPADLGLRVELGVGEALVSGLKGNVHVEVGVGNIEVSMAEQAVKDVDLEVGVGEACLRRGGENLEGHGFVGQELEWQRGPGESRVKLHAGVGDVELELN